MRLTKEGFTDEQFRWCFWGPTGGGSAASDEANRGGFGGSNRDGGDDNRDDDFGFDVGGYVDSAISDFGRATGGTSNDRDSDGIPDTIDIDAGTGTGQPVGGVRGGRDDSPVPMAPRTTAPMAPPMATGYGIQSPNFVQESIRGFTGPQTQTVQQAMSYPSGMNISPYSPGAVTFADGSTARTYDPLGREQAVRFNLGVAPTETQGEQSIADRIRAGFEGAFSDVNQRAAVFDPQTGRFTSPTMEKTSENRFQDFAVNLLNPFSGLTGVIDTADYVPLEGGETYQFSQMQGGLLGLLGAGDPALRSYSDIQAEMQADMRDGGDGNARLTIAPEEEEEDEEDAETTPGFDVADPYIPPQREYQPFEADFYNIPQRFMSRRRSGFSDISGNVVPRGLLGRIT